MLGNLFWDSDVIRFHVQLDQKIMDGIVSYHAGRGVSKKVSAVGFCLGSGLFGSYNSD